MKKLLFLLTICTAATFTIGCGGGGPGTATKEEADKSMEDSMVPMDADTGAPASSPAKP